MVTQLALAEKITTSRICQKR